MKDSYDVVLVGGGVNGLGISYNLQKRGLSTLVVEKNVLGGGATGRCGAGIRQQWSTAENIKIAMGAVKIFEGLSEELGNDIGFRQGGYLVMVHDEKELEESKKKVELQKSLGLDVRIIDPPEINDIVPMLDVEGINAIAATFCPTDGHANPFKTVHAYASAALREGADIMKFTEVQGFEMKDSTITAVKTSKGTVKTKWVVNAAGAWSAKVAQMAGVKLPNKPYRHEIAGTEPLKRMFDPMVISFRDGIYFSQMDEGQIVGGVGDPAEVPGFHINSTFRFLQRYSTLLTRYVPAFKSLKLMRTWAGYYDVSPDARPILGPSPTVENLIQCNGFSGHGFMLSPMVAEMITDYIADGKESPDMKSLNLSRFEDESLLNMEANVVG